MVSVSKRTFSLPTKLAGYVDAKIRSGAYASGSEVIRAGLRAALQETGRRCSNDGCTTNHTIYDATKADPSSRIPAKAAFAEARARYSKRRKARL